MKAIRKSRPGKGVEITDVPKPVAKDDLVLCRVLATSICGTDVHIYNWDKWAENRIKPPMTFGHEFCGEVIEVGPKVKNIKVGDRVSAETHIPCHNCKQCKTNNMHICNNLKILGLDVDGCFAEFVAVPEICCIKQSSNLPIEACSVLEPFGNAVHAVSESNVKNKTVAIFGDGPTGLLAVLVAKAYGASKVFAIGAQDYRLELFKKMQPDYTFDARKVDPVSKIMELTNNEGVDVVLEMSGSEKAIHAGFKVVSPGGTFSFFGIPSKNIELDVADEIIFKGIKINAIVGRRMFKTWNEMAELLNSDSVDISSVITHKFRLEEIDEAMKLLEHDNIRAGKIVLIP